MIRFKQKIKKKSRFKKKHFLKLYFMAASSSTGWELKPDYPLVVRVTTATIKRTFFGKKNNPSKKQTKT